MWYGKCYWYYYSDGNEYSESTIVNTDAMYQHSDDEHHAYDNRSDRHRSTGRTTGRSYGSLGSKCYHDQRHTDSKRNIQLYNTTYRRMRYCQCNRNDNSDGR